MFDVKKFGAFLSKLRKQADMTQSELSDKLNLSRQAISKYENGDSFPDISILLLISETFKISLDNLIGAGGPTPAEAAVLTNLAKDHEIPNGIFDQNVVRDIVNIAPLLKPSILDRMATGLQKQGIDISNLVRLAEYMNDESVIKLLETATFDTLDEEMLEKIIPFLNDESKYSIFDKILEGELDYRLIRVLIPHAEYLVSQVEAAVVYGALDEKALKFLHN
jgi:transcriptional regulator with XRE-family HTH domain